MAAGLPPTALAARGISVRLGSSQILNGLDLPDLPAGALVALLGPNGCGKSTLLKSIAGLIPCSSLTLTLDGQDLRLRDATERAALIRYLPQSLPGDVHLTVVEAVLVALKARQQVAQASARLTVTSILATLDIADLAHRYLDELSGGQKQLVGLAQALIHEPRVLLLDEPLASLDMNYQHHVMQQLVRLTAERNLLAVIVLHDLNMALRYADVAMLMRQGRLTACGDPKLVITPDTLAQTFSIRARVELCSLGQPHVFVDDLIQV